MNQFYNPYRGTSSLGGSQPFFNGAGPMQQGGSMQQAVPVPFPQSTQLPNGGGMMSPNGGMMSPNGGMMSPNGGMMPPPGGMMPPGGGMMPPVGATGPQGPGMLPIEQSYIENILRLNKGKLATVYATFENNTQWNAKIFKGIIEAAGRDHLILSDPETGQRILLLMVYLDYVTFDEEIEYEYPFAGGAGPSLSTFPPR